MEQSGYVKALRASKLDGLCKRKLIVKDCNPFKEICHLKFHCVTSSASSNPSKHVLLHCSLRHHTSVPGNADSFTNLLKKSWLALGKSTLGTTSSISTENCCRDDINSALFIEFLLWENRVQERTLLTLAEITKAPSSQVLIIRGPATESKTKGKWQWPVSKSGFGLTWSDWETH